MWTVGLKFTRTENEPASEPALLVPIAASELEPDWRNAVVAAPLFFTAGECWAIVQWAALGRCFRTRAWPGIGEACTP